MDERMGDEVKITVIATGFQQDMPERRARMLSESTLPGAAMRCRFGRLRGGASADAETTGPRGLRAR